jgi:FdrA protein
LIRGLYSGGTLCQEAALVLQESGLTSQAATSSSGANGIALPGQAHCLIDIGDDEFTVGRPHPMIDLSLRSQLMLECAADPRTAVVLFDVVLGFGAHPDPAGVLAEAVGAARERAARDGRELSFVASVCGTDADSQGSARSESVLQAVGVPVLPANAQAARLACLIAAGGDVDERLCSAVPSRSNAALPPGTATELFGTPCRVVNVGLRGFYDALRSVGAPVAQVDWRPPLGGDPALADRLSRIV